VSTLSKTIGNQNMPRTGRRSRSPWWVVFGAGVASAVGPGPVVMSTLGLFVVPITEETGWGRSTVTGSFSLAAIGSAIGLVIVGRMMDRYALKYILIPSYILFNLFMALIAFAPSDNVLLFLAPYFHSEKR
jgi:MFS family permease